MKVFLRPIWAMCLIVLKHVLLVCMFSFALAGQAIADSLSDAMHTYAAGDYAKAAKLYRPLAKKGSAEAQFYLGVMYANGEGMPRDAVKAVEWYRLAAEQGDASAQYILAVMYDSGQGAPQDHKEAVKWYRLAAEQGNAGAQAKLGATYGKGMAVLQGNTATVSESAPAARPQRASDNTAIPPEPASTTLLSDVKRTYYAGDYAKAAKLCRPLAKKGNAEAQFYLGLMYANGEGVPRDTVKAVEWCRLAAGQGDASAQYMLAVMYDFGSGVPQDHKEAVKWYRLAAEQGNAHAQAKLAAMYGNGAPQDDTDTIKRVRISTDANSKLNKPEISLSPTPSPAAQPQRASDNTVTPPEPVPVAPSTGNNGNTALFRIDRFDVKDNTLLDPVLIERLLAPFKGKDRSYTDLQRALEALEGAFRTAGYSAVNVITPEQEVTAGIVTFQVLEPRVGKVILKGNERYDKTNIRNALPALAEGFTPSARELSENLRLANENPTRQLEVVLTTGEEENTVDANINVQENSPHKTFVTLDNTGNQSTGMYRVGMGYQHNNLFNRDHALTLNYITSPNHVKDVTQLSASYRLPIYAVGDSVDLIAAYSDSNAGTTSVGGPGGPLLTFSGKGNVYGAHYNHYLQRRGDYTSKVVAGLDYRASINNCLLAGAACPGTPDVTVLPLTITYGGTLTKPTYVADFSTAFAHNLPGGSHGGSDVFGATRTGAPADFNIMRLNGSMAGVLPQNWQYRLAGNAQYADALIPSENLSLVGANAVRGFQEGEFRHNNGYVLNAELYTPDMAPNLNIKDSSLRLLGFVDSASGWNKLLPGELANRTSVGSVGVGLRYTYNKNITAKFDLAKVACGDTDGKSCIATNIISRTGNTRGHMSLMGTW